jgi:prepilin-type N-terminal cleavage/methylation domain-containing protein
MDRRGFSLVEVLISVVIVGIILGFAMSAIDPLRPQMESAMLGIGSSLQGAQRESVARQHNVIATFDAAANKVELHFDANNNGVRDGGERVRVVALEGQVTFGRANAPARAFGAGPISFPPGGGGLPTLTFRRDGSASIAGGLYVTSRKAAAGSLKRIGDTRAIEVVRATGRVEWWRYNGAVWRRGF